MRIPNAPATVLVTTLLLAPAAAAAQAPPPSPDTPVAPAALAIEPSIGSPSFRREEEEEVAARPRLFTGLHRDFRRLVSADQMWIAAIGGASAMSLHTLDGGIAGSNWGRGSAREVFGPGEIVGGGLVQASAALGTYAVGRLTNQPRIARLGGELVRAQIVAQTITQTIKVATQRTRPDGSTLSFPSGHTASTFATATVVQREFGWKAGIPAYALASWVAASRMHAERHFLSDVVMGATVGIMAGRAVTVGTTKTRFSISPIVADGGIGVSFVKVK
jgi:membrane-associated phospholipid phosphatase